MGRRQMIVVGAGGADGRQRCWELGGEGGVWRGVERGVRVMWWVSMCCVAVTSVLLARYSCTGADATTYQCLPGGELCRVGEPVVGKTPCDAPKDTTIECRYHTTRTYMHPPLGQIRATTHARNV